MRPQGWVRAPVAASSMVLGAAARGLPPTPLRDRLGLDTSSARDPERKVPFGALFAAALVMAYTTEAHAQSPEPQLDSEQPLQGAQAGRDPEAPRYGFSVALGLGQWALGGGNVAVQGRIGRLALEYSHGQGVHLSELTLLMNASEKAVGADVCEPWTTGFGVGVIVAENRWMNLRILVEGKANHYNVRGGDRNTELDYTTFTVGPGVFYEVRIWRGLFLQPSLRWWPTVASTFKSGSTLRTAEGTSVTMERHESGVFPNINLGWEF